MNLVTGAEPEPEPNPPMMETGADHTTPEEPPTPTREAPEADEQKTCANVNPDSPGCEGCFANTLHFFGAFSGRLTDVKRALNAQIDTVHAEFAAQNPDSLRDKAGRENDYWHTKVALNAFKAHYGDGHFTFKKIKCANLDNVAVYKSGKNYILDGVLAPHFQDPTDKQRVTHEDYKTFQEDDPSWRHCVGLMTNGPRGEPTHYVLSKGLPGNYDSIAVLHLGTPRTSLCNNLKFFWRINKAYEVDFPDIRTKPRPPPRPAVEVRKKRRKRKSNTQKKKQKKPQTPNTNTPEAE